MSEAEIATKIVELLSNNPTHSVRGAELAVLLKDACGYSSAVHGKLRELVDTHVPLVVRRHVAGAGMDWIYTLKSALPAVSDDPTATPPAQPIYEAKSSHQGHGFWKVDPKVWKTFVSPTGLFKLFGNHETGQFVVLPQEAAPPEGPWKHIPSCTVDDHLNTANKWFKTVSDPRVRSLLETAIKTGTGPDSIFYETVKKFELTLEWNKFRSKRLLVLLDAHLVELGIPKRDSAVSIPSVGHATETARQRVEDGSTQHPQRALDIALAAVRRMTDAEIRNLSIPLGHVLDVLNIR